MIKIRNILGSIFKRSGNSVVHKTTQKRNKGVTQSTGENGRNANINIETGDINYEDKSITSNTIMPNATQSNTQGSVGYNDTQQKLARLSGKYDIENIDNMFLSCLDTLNKGVEPECVAQAAHSLLGVIDALLKNELVKQMIIDNFKEMPTVLSGRDGGIYEFRLGIEKIASRVEKCDVGSFHIIISTFGKCIEEISKPV